MKDYTQTSQSTEIEYAVINREELLAKIEVLNNLTWLLRDQLTNLQDNPFWQEPTP